MHDSKADQVAINAAPDDVWVGVLRKMKELALWKGPAGFIRLFDEVPDFHDLAVGREVVGLVRLEQAAATSEA